MKRLISLAVLFAIVPTMALAQAWQQAGIASYRHAILMLRSHKASLEQVFYTGLNIRNLLLKTDSRGTTLLETLSSTDFEALKTELTGFVIGRDEAIFVNADPAYFDALAREFGDAGDRAFFDAYRRTRPGGVWPVWIEQRTDEAGCTKFGGGDLVGTYRVWNEYRHNYPRRYRTEVDGFLASVEDEASGATCACGDAASVLKELEEFDRAFPDTRASDVVRQRIRELRENRSPIRFECLSAPASRIVR